MSVCVWFILIILYKKINTLNKSFSHFEKQQIYFLYLKKGEVILKHTINVKEETINVIKYKYSNALNCAFIVNFIWSSRKEFIEIF